MFYSQFILAKKGPLGTIWIAAHLERKLRKNQVAETDIGVTVDSILFPDVPIALRLSGHLLLGVVRVYSRQVNYLFNDCSETLVKIKQAFHSTAVDLPPEATTAPFHSITLPETFDFDELELLQDSETAFLRGPNGNYVDHHVTSREHITLQDSIENNPYLGSSQFGLDERFGDGNFSAMAMDFDEEFLAKKSQDAAASMSTPLLMEETFPSLNDGKDEATQMDIDDPYATTETHYQNKKIVSDHEDVTMLNIDQNEEGNHRHLSMTSPFPEPLEDQIIASIASPSVLEPLKDGNESIVCPPIGADDTAAVMEMVPSTVSYKHDRLNVHAYMPYVEAYTPDLNVEFHPPDEPSTPALLDEASLPMYKESSVETQRKSPLGLQENAGSSNAELEAGSLSTNQASPNIQSEHQKQQPSPQPFTELASSPTLNLQKENAGAPSIMDGEHPSILSDDMQMPNLHVSSIEATEDPKFNLEGFTFSHGSAPGLPNDDLVGTSLNPMDGIDQNCSIAGVPNLVPSFQLVGCKTLSTVSLNTQLDFSNSNQEVIPSPGPDGTVISSGQPLLASLNIIHDAVASDQQSMELHDVTSTLMLPSVQVDTSLIPIVSEVSETASFEQTMTESIETQVVPSTQSGDASGEQLNVLPETSMQLPMSMGEIPECETLRSGVDLPKGTSGLILLEKKILDERIPTLESERTKTGMTESYTVAVEPVFDETPVLKEWNPQTASKTSPLSTGNLSFLPGDNDVLASILGRRKSNAFKVASTPKESVIVKKRKVAPKSVPKKRKCEFDTSVVLHGDVIRQQLAYTEDIRRERSKAPCTRREVWSFNKEVEGQQHFDEPLFLGFHSDLHDLFHNVLNAHELSPYVDKELKEDTPLMKSTESLTDISSKMGFSNDSEDKQPSKDDSIILQSMISDRPEISVLEDLSEHQGGATGITGNLNEDLVAAEIINHLDSDTQDNRQEVSDNCTVELPSIIHDDPQVQTLEDINISGEEPRLEVLQRTEESEIAVEVMDSAVLEGAQGSDQAIEAAPGATEQAVEIMDMEVLEAPQASEQAVERTHTEEVLEEPETSKQDVELTHIEVLEGQIAIEQAVEVKVPQTNEQAVELKHPLSEVQESNERVVEKDVLNKENSPGKEPSTAIEMEYNGSNEDAIGGQDNILAGTTTVNAERSLEHVSIQLCTQDTDQRKDVDLHRDEKNSQSLDADLEKDVIDLSMVRDKEYADVSATQLEATDGNSGIQAALDCPVENDGEVSVIMEKDGHTDFLADDDETVYAEVYEDSGDERDPSILENSGWSVRSRKVGRYLKTIFEGMEDVSYKTGEEARNLGLERLLAYKTRREAARMFFETLVLKTKGYIQVKQELAYEDIHLYPSPKLMKTMF